MKRFNKRKLVIELVIGFIIINIVASILFLEGFISLNLLIYNVFALMFASLVTFIIEYVKVLLSDDTLILIGKIVYTIGIGAALGFLMWAFTGSALFFQPWSPFYNISNSLKDIMIFLLMISSYIFAGYIGYKIGERRGFKPRTYKI